MLLLVEPPVLLPRLLGVTADGNDELAAKLSLLPGCDWPCSKLPVRSCMLGCCCCCCCRCCSELVLQLAALILADAPMSALAPYKLGPSITAKYSPVLLLLLLVLYDAAAAFELAVWSDLTLLPEADPDPELVADWLT
jgi:hypothetical protein